MKIKNNISGISILLLLLIGCAEHEAPARLDTAAIEQAQVKNLVMPAEHVFSSGQPTKEQFRVLAKNGIKHVINLRAPGEIDWDEPGLVKSLGMEYHSIPVAGASGITVENARRLHQLLDSLKTEPVLVHCGSGNRIGALVSVYEAEVNGKDIEAAIAEGKRWGLTRAESVVRKILTSEE